MCSDDTRRCNVVIESRALLLFEPMDDGGVGGVGIRYVISTRVYRVHGRIATNPLILIPTIGFVVVTPEFLELLVLLQLCFSCKSSLLHNIALYDECTLDYFVNAHIT